MTRQERQWSRNKGNIPEKNVFQPLRGSNASQFRRKQVEVPPSHVFPRCNLATPWPFSIYLPYMKSLSPLEMLSGSAHQLNFNLYDSPLEHFIWILILIRVNFDWELYDRRDPKSDSTKTRIKILRRQLPTGPINRSDFSYIPIFISLRACTISTHFWHSSVRFRRPSVSETTKEHRATKRWSLTEIGSWKL